MVRQHPSYLSHITANCAEIIVSGGMTMPQIITPVERVDRQAERITLNRLK